MLTRAKTFVNSLRTIGRAPPEILTMISAYLDEEDLFSASQVCKYLRSTLISFPSLWTQISCSRVARTNISLERCGSLPIQLRLELASSSDALEDVLLHGNNIVSLTVQLPTKKTLPLHKLLASSIPHLERLHIYHVPPLWEWRVQEWMTDESWQRFPSLRQLFVGRFPLPIDRLAAPNLTHLALESTGRGNNVTVQTILDMLRQSPLLETLLISYPGDLRPTTPHGHSPVRLPHLRSIEVGVREVRSGLITHLDFPPNITAGFRTMRVSDVCGNIPPAVLATVEHVLGRIDIHRVTLAAAINSRGNMDHLVQLEGAQGSLEINAFCTDPETLPAIFGPKGILFPHRSRIENVRELQIIDCCLGDSQELHLLHLAMPNIVSISISSIAFLGRFRLLTPSDPSPVPFPHLERVLVLGSEFWLEEMARRRRDLGVRLKTLIVGRVLGGSEHGRLKDWTVLGGLVGDLWVGCPVQISEWGAETEIASIWATVMPPGKVSLKETWYMELTTFCSGISSSERKCSNFVDLTYLGARTWFRLQTRYLTMTEAPSLEDVGAEVVLFVGGMFPSSRCYV